MNEHSHLREVRKMSAPMTPMIFRLLDQLLTAEPKTLEEIKTGMMRHLGYFFDDEFVACRREAAEKGWMKVIIRPGQPSLLAISDAGLQALNEHVEQELARRRQIQEARLLAEFMRDYWRLLFSAYREGLILLEEHESPS